MELTRENVSVFLQQLGHDDQTKWMLAFGEVLTIAARGTYDETSSALQLKGFNEIQNDIYSRVRDVKRGHDWPIEEWFSGLLIWAEHCEIRPKFGWALHSSIETFKTEQHTGL